MTREALKIMDQEILPYNERRYTLTEIACTINQSQRRMGLRSDLAGFAYPDPSTWIKVELGQAKARRESGSSWNVEKIGKMEIRYDFPHVVLILDALTELSQSPKANVRNSYQSLGITQDVIIGARKILFGSEEAAPQQS